jgi:hypothetical protein
MTQAGLLPTPPATIRATLLANVAATNPGYTANLPASLVEDISSTDVGAVVLIDAAKVETVNSLTPLGANAFLLNQLGAIYGVLQGAATNTSVLVVFSGPPGFVVVKGFTVSDGTYQYVVQDGGVIGASGQTVPLFAVATQSGTWAVPSGTVTQIVTSVPSAVSPPITASNPFAGTPSAGPQAEADYRAAVLQAGIAPATGMATLLKTLLGQVSGVQPRLVSPLLVAGNWEVIVGGGDPYQVAYAIYTALFNVGALVGSTLLVTGISNANPGVVTTNLNHGYATGQVVNIAGANGIAGVNGVPLTATVVDQKNFSIGINTTLSGAWTSGGVVTPNLRNQAISINDYPDTYIVPFVVPPQQAVAMTVTWNTTAANFVSPSAVAQLAQPALAGYVNGIPVGLPINLFELQAVFQAAIASILSPQLLTRMVFAVSINGIGVAPSAGTGIIAGDPESYMFTTIAAITVVQG